MTSFFKALRLAAVFSRNQSDVSRRNRAVSPSNLFEVIPLKWLIGASILCNSLFIIWYAVQWILFGPERLRTAVLDVRYAVAAAILVWLLMVSAYIALNRFKDRITVIVIVWCYFFITLGVIQTFSLGVRSPLFNLTYVLIVFTGFLLGSWHLFSMSAISVLAILWFYVQEQIGWMNFVNGSDIDDLLAINFSILMMTALVWRIMLTLKSRSKQLYEHQAHLEQLVEQKTADLQAALTVAEKANHAKSVFLATMSHELRTPLNAIIGYSEMTLEDVEQIGFQNQHLEDITRVRDSGKHLLHLINMILDVSKVEAGEDELHLSKFSASLVLEEALQFCQPMISKSGSRAEIEMKFSNELSVLADYKKLLQILINLVGNAAKFTQDGLIILNASHCEQSDMIRFEIRDTGIGLPEDEIETLFEPFKQGEEAYDRKYAGTGLGLAISKKFCDMMNGSISAHNDPAGGAIFQVLIPIAPD